MLALVAVTLVVCAPGSPGSSTEAQPAMDALARSLATAAHLPPGSLSAVYEETESGGLRRLGKKDAALLLATLPFYLAHEKDLKAVARLSTVPQGGEALQKWTLVTGKDHPASLEGYTVQSTAGWSKRFVRAVAPNLPPSVRIEPVPAVLSALRRAAAGEKIAVLLDGPQAAGLQSLPFAASLAVVSTSPPMPVAVVSTVSNRIDARRWKELEAALLNLAKDPSAREALDGVRMTAFAPLDTKALETARTAFRRAR